MKSISKARVIAAVLMTVVSATGFLPSAARAMTAPPPQRTLYFGVAYYDEYSPDPARLETDVAMMKAANINVVRIAESTWGTLEPQDGQFDFSHVDRVLAAMQRAGIKVIIGTPTYAIPTWLAMDHPQVLVERPNGKARYGTRQNMDIINPEYRKQAEEVIIALVDHVRAHPAVIGYQIDNETKAYDTSGPNVQAEFVERMKRKWPSLDAMNDAFGLNYWSNRINAWKDFPSVNGAQNASLTSAFAEFQRDLATEFLAWQAKLVRAHARPDQFVTQNFDLDWRGWSYGVRPEVNHFEAAKTLDVVGMDIYHPTQDKLTGVEIALGGDIARSIGGGKSYLVIETEAQGFPQWTPYPGQLRLQAFSHLASGANMVAYWHWGTTANGFETYWRGLLGQDFQPNPTYEEAKTIGAEFRRLGPQLVNLEKHNRVAVYVSNRAQTAFNAFKNRMGEDKAYNDVLRPFYDALYRLNVEVDFIDPSKVDLSGYKLIVVPALYAASDVEIARLNAFAQAGGHVVYSFKSGVSDENVRVRYAKQPGDALSRAAGVEYNQFTLPENVGLKGAYTLPADGKPVRWWMEFLRPTTAEVIASYDHPVWGRYAAITRNRYGAGEVTYIGFMPSDDLAERLMADAAARAGLGGAEQSYQFPIIVRTGVLNNGRSVRYVFNYSATTARVANRLGAGLELLSGKAVAASDDLALGPWGVAIIQGDTALRNAAPGRGR